jgi:hypothetical protein
MSLLHRSFLWPIIVEVRKSAATTLSVGELFGALSLDVGKNTIGILKEREPSPLGLINR